MKASPHETHTSHGLLPPGRFTTLIAIAGSCYAGAVLLLGSSAQAQNLFEADYASGNIYEFTNGAATNIGLFASGLDGPKSLAFDQAGNLFEADYGSGNIYEFTNCVATNKGLFASGLNVPDSLAFDPAGNLFEADLLSGTIYEFTNCVAANKGIFVSGLNGPSGLVFDSAGDLFESDDAGGGNYGSIQEFTNGLASEPGTFATVPTAPIGMAFDSAGNLFVADVGDNLPGQGKIYKFTPEGERSTFASGLSYPIGLVIDSAGDLFEADFNSGTIYEFTNGTATNQGIFASGLSPAGLAFQPVIVHPTISASSASATVSPGGTASLSVSASGGDLSYQWAFQGTNIAGATNATLTITNFSPGDVGGYTVTVSNPAGSITSRVVTLASVSINMFAGVIVDGPIGSNYLIQAASSLAGTNWVTLTNVVLPTQPYIYIDYSSPTNGQQFYRAVPEE